MTGETPDDSGWYGVRCVFRSEAEAGAQYEERVTLWRAQSFGAAHKIARQDARRFAGASGAEFLEYSEAYFIDREIFELDAEVFSWQRESDLAPADYISTFYSTGKERGRGCRPSPGSGGGAPEWYGVRCLFWWSGWAGRPFEERITLWQAASAGHATELAEQEAREYCVPDSGIEYLGFPQVYGCGAGGSAREGMVAFSLLRDSDLAPDGYIAAFFNTGRERVRPDRDN